MGPIWNPLFSINHMINIKKKKLMKKKIYKRNLGPLQQVQKATTS